MGAGENQNPQAGAGRPLPKKEADLFKNVVKHYEMKQYKKAIKQADTILKKFPKHGETLAMKGLTLNYMNKRDDAHALVKEGLTNDMRSHVCWHVYGLLHRSDRNYNEAIKAYKQALRIDAENLQILRDLSMLQIQMRDLNGFALTRHTLLSIKPNAKINWLAFALAKHLTGDLRGAISVIDIYLGTLTEGSPELGRCYESSELALYRNTILGEIPNNYKEALDHLSVCENIVVDRGAWLFTRAKYQLKLRDYNTARQTVLTMFKRGMTDNYRIHSLYMCALLQIDNHELCDKALKLNGTKTLSSLIPMSAEQKQILLQAYQQELQPLFPTSLAIRRIPLSLMEEDQLRKSLDYHCRRDLSKGVPSLCSELACFFLIVKDGYYIKADDPIDIKRHPLYKLIVDLIDSYVSSLDSYSKFAPDDKQEESPSTILWAWYVRAGLHELAGEYKEGISLLDKCLDHTPTAVDIYELKARILKAAGDIKAAVECIDVGRDLDRQDRYINNQTTRYMLQAGMEDEALKRISLFTRHEGNPEQNLFDMQCSWYELELAACLEHKGEWGRSLKKYSAVVKHFADFSEDQFDFHAYCLRKVTLRAYTDVLRFEDELYGEEYYFEAVDGIIRIYLHLYDNPSLVAKEEEPDYSKMTAAERKKAKAIARKKKKAAEKKEAAAQKAKAENGKNSNKNNASSNAANKNNNNNYNNTVVDEDPDGKELLKKDPLEESKKYSAIISANAPHRLKTWTMQYDVAVRRKKYLMALQALFKAQRINSQSSEYISRVIDFAVKTNSLRNDNSCSQEEQMPTGSAVRAVINAEMPKLLGCEKSDVIISFSDFLLAESEKIRKNADTDLPTRVVIAKALAETKTSSVADASSLILDGGLDCKKVTIETCGSALAALKAFGGEDDVAKKIESWITQVGAKFPLLSNFS